jgi:hypothetical protein
VCCYTPAAAIADMTSSHPPTPTLFAVGAVVGPLCGMCLQLQRNLQMQTQVNVCYLYAQLCCCVIC